MAESSAVTAGDTILASHFNDLRTDALAQKTAARVVQNTQVIPDLTATVITFDSEVFDTGSYWAVGNPERFTITTAGIYQIHFHIGDYGSDPIAALTDFQVDLWKNSAVMTEAENYAQYWKSVGGVAVDPEVDFVCLVNASANDYFYFKVIFDRTDDANHTANKISMEIMSL